MPIVVAQKEARSRVELRRGAPRVTPTGTLEETTEPVRVVEYFVRAEGDGAWYRVSERAFGAVAHGQQIEVCR